MSVVLERPPAAAPTSSAAPTAVGRSPAKLRALELAGIGLLFVLAVLLRWPYLWDIPRFTDELQEVLWSLAIWHGEIRPLTAVDSYYGPLWSYLLAGLFTLFGPSPFLARLVALLLGAGLVVLTYLLGRDVAGRWPAAIAAGLLLTSGGHIIINSHTARSNSTTPLFTTAALWMLYRALADRSWAACTGDTIARRPDPRLLFPAGLLLGLALQTHLSVVALLPGLAAYALWKGWRLLRSPWPYLAALAVPLGYLNMIAYNVQNDFWSFRHARSLQSAYTDARPTDLDLYVTNLANLVQSLSRLLSGTIDSGDSPSRFLYTLLALLGLGLLARRGGLLLVLAGLSLVAVLPYFNPRYGPILSGRYLIPLLPIGYLAIGCVVVAGGHWLSTRATAWQPSIRLAPIVLGLGLILYPLLPLHSYYQAALAEGRTNQPLYQLAAAVTAARRPGEIVVLDEGLAQEQLGAGGTDLKAFRMLLGTQGIPYEIDKVAEAADLLSVERTSALFLMEAKKRSSLSRDVSAEPVSPEVTSASGNEHRYRVFRVSAR